MPAAVGAVWLLDKFSILPFRLGAPYFPIGRFFQCNLSPRGSTLGRIDGSSKGAKDGLQRGQEPYCFHSPRRDRNLVYLSGAMKTKLLESMPQSEPRDAEPPRGPDLIAAREFDRLGEKFALQCSEQSGVNFD
jgi:hypothetical protein